MSKPEIDHKFDEIVDFSGVEKFIDTPVKRYSSGMKVRLAFAVAAHLEPEILLIDEVLAVGDAEFQRKCLGKMKDVAGEGRTVLFVSHNMVAIQNLCPRTIHLNDGEIMDDGPSNQVVSHYLQNEAFLFMEQVWDDPSTAPGNDAIRLHRVRVKPLHQAPGEPITVETTLELTFEFWNNLPNETLNFSVFLSNLENITVFNAVSPARSFAEGLVCGSFVIPGNFLNDAVYTVRLLIVKDTSVVLLEVHDILKFEVQDVKRTGNWYGKWIGIVRPTFDWRLSTGL
jgi:lipopolysaccharide transport system ATP-binding protein